MKRAIDPSLQDRLPSYPESRTDVMAHVDNVRATNPCVGGRVVRYGSIKTIAHRTAHLFTSLPFLLPIEGVDGYICGFGLEPRVGGIAVYNLVNGFGLGGCLNDFRRAIEPKGRPRTEMIPEFEGDIGFRSPDTDGERCRIRDIHRVLQSGSGHPGMGLVNDRS